MKLSVINPNLSVIMPVGCNAKCSFCYWKSSCGLTENRFKFICDTLPEIFEQCSITGGEPTLHNNLISYLIIAKNRFKKVVLNTNGYNLNKEIISLCDHINISRHHYDEQKNRTIFNCNNVPEISKIYDWCQYSDITLNCFLESNFSNIEFINNYINFAKELKAKVAFRKYYSDLNILSVDTNDTLISYHSCGACLHRKHIINEVYVTFKYSVNETFEHMNGIYELILQSNGDLTFDWQGKHKLKYKEK